MSTDRSPDRTIRAWLDLMPDEVPDRVIADVLQAVDGSPQVRRPLVIGPRRFQPMNRLVLIAAAALIGVAVLGGAILVGGPRQAPVPAPVASPVAVAPSGSPAARPSAPSSRPIQSTSTKPQVNGAPTRLRKAWTADVPAIEELGFAGGPVTLTISDDGLRLTSTEVGTAGSFSSSIDLLNYRYALVPSDTFGPCAAGAKGLYQGLEGDSASSLELVKVSEPCTAMAELLERVWLPQSP